MENKTKLWNVILLLIVIGGVWYFASHKKEEAPATSKVIIFGEITTKYITAQEWPPKVEIVNEPFSCTEVPLTADVAKETEGTVISGENYCVSKISEGAAGSTYTTYTYTRANGNLTDRYSFTLRFVQCENYDDPQKTECKTERANFSANSFFE